MVVYMNPLETGVAVTIFLYYMKYTYLVCDQFFLSTRAFGQTSEVLCFFLTPQPTRFIPACGRTSHKQFLIRTITEGTAAPAVHTLIIQGFKDKNNKINLITSQD